MSFANPAADARAAAPRYVASLLELLGGRDPFVVQSELPDALSRAVAGLSEEVLRTPEAPGKWSVLEVVRHLADSELVTGYRMRMILAHDRPEIQGYDQDAFARELHYREGDLELALEQIRVLRAANLALLRSLSDEQMERCGVHSERGEESIRHIVRLIAAHDLLHRRQIERIKSAVGV